MPLDPQARAMLDFLASLGAPQTGTVSAPEQRAAMAARPLPPGMPVAAVENRNIPTRDGEIPVRIYTPDGQTPFPTLVWYHGGGWVVGSLDISDHVARELANTASCIVVSVDYRLAPEYKFPTAADDCEDAYKWVLANAETFGGDPRRVAVGGDSAGGNLAAVVSIRAKEHGLQLPAFQLLVYPVTDSDFERPSYQANGDDYGLTRQGMIWYWDQYARDASDIVHPHAAPLRAEDLSGLPPALVITAEFDPLLDEGEAYGDRLREAGIPVTVSRYDGMIHGFFGMYWAIDKGRAAVDEAATALGSAFALQPV